MAIFTIKDLSFTYPLKKEPALKKINVTVSQGEFITLCGKSGCGKSTLLRSLKTDLAPHGQRTGEILFDGRPLQVISKREQASRIGFVLQSPEHQIVTDKVWHELAFGLESLGYDTKTIRVRVAEMASFFGIQTWFMKNVQELSGGQKQLLNLAAVMAMQPDILILDEPTSQLDPIAANDFLETVSKINREIGTTVILTEHRLENVLPVSDRTIVLDDGEVIVDDRPENACAILAQKKHPMYLAMPAPLQAYAAMYDVGIGRELPCPITVRDGRKWLTALFHNRELTVTSVAVPEAKGFQGKTSALQLRDVWFRYERDGQDIIKDLSAEVYAGELFCVVGGNGSGKSTMLSLVSGIRKPYRGKIKCRAGQIGALPQNPQSIFVEKTVKLDFLEILEEVSSAGAKGLTKEEKEERVLAMARLVDVEHLLESHPYDLSGGEQQRAALGKVLLVEPDLLLLDEPTKGLDVYFKKKLAQILKQLTEQGVTIVLVSHDVEFCCRYADRCAMFFDGNIITVNTPNRFFSGNNFYTTAANRMSRHFFENAVTCEDVVELCCKNFNVPIPPEAEAGNTKPPGGGRKEEKKEDRRPSDDRNADSRSGEGPKQRKKIKWPLTLSLLMIPAALFAGIVFLDDRKYYWIGFLILALVTAPFLMIFEQRKPQARELIVVAVMAAMAVAGRAAFFMVPSFKPVIALVMISGVCLGAETGFLVGAMAGFVSNFLFGQGPWTPWQMAAFGLIGFLTGLLTEKQILKTNKKALMIFGALATFFLYGGIVDLWTIFGMSAEVNWGVVLTVYGLAIPFNVIHAASTVIFLYFLANPMIDKLERIKIKYGMF